MNSSTPEVTLLDKAQVLLPLNDTPCHRQTPQTRILTFELQFALCKSRRTLLRHNVTPREMWGKTIPFPALDQPGLRG